MKWCKEDRIKLEPVSHSHVSSSTVPSKTTRFSCLLDSAAIQPQSTLAFWFTLAFNNWPTVEFVDIKISLTGLLPTSFPLLLSPFRMLLFALSCSSRIPHPTYLNFFCTSISYRVFESPLPDAEKKLHITVVKVSNTTFNGYRL